MMKNKKTIALFFILGLILAAAGSYGGAQWYKLSHYDRWIASVATGDSKQAVIQKMGKPDVVQSRPALLWCSAQDCDSEFMYGQSIPPVWWVVGFDRNGNVVMATKLRSPRGIR